MTINLAWKFKNIVYLVADSIISSSGDPLQPLTSIGEQTGLGDGVRRNEEATKIVALSDTVVATFRGDVRRAEVFLGQLKLRLQHAGQKRTPEDLGQILTQTFNRVHQRGAVDEDACGL